jgi:hypothetical protein
MAEINDHITQYTALLENQKAVLEEAKAYKGLKPSPSMKRSRRDLEREFTIVQCPSS